MAELAALPKPALPQPAPPHHPVIVVGGGQAGLSASHHLGQAGIDHLVLERHRIGHAWRTQRWDSFCLVTPNWQCRLPGFPYDGPDPHGFMRRDEIVAYLDAYAALVRPPIREGVAVTRLSRAPDGRFRLDTTDGALTANEVVLAVSGYHVPALPPLAARLPDTLVQVHSSAYRNPGQLPEGAVLVVGSGQSGCQIAEDLHLAGRQVHLSLGSAPRSPRAYRGRDAIDWLDAMGQYAMTVDEHPRGTGVRTQANHYFTGRDGGREIDLRVFARDGMALHGRLTGIEGGRLRFADDVRQKLDAADAVYCGIREMIDRYIADQGVEAPGAPPYHPVWQPAGDEPLDLDIGVLGSVVWATGFRSDWRWVDLPAFTGAGYPDHRRGLTSVEGLSVLGLPWLHTWGSGRFSGIAEDARHVVEAIRSRLGDRASAARRAYA